MVHNLKLERTHNLVTSACELDLSLIETRLCVLRDIDGYPYRTSSARCHIKT